MKVKIIKGKNKGKIGRVMGIYVKYDEYKTGGRYDLKIGQRYFIIPVKNTVVINY